MNIATTIATVAASLTIAAGAGATVFAPGTDDAATAPGTPGGDAVVWIHDQQTDPIEGVGVVAISHTTRKHVGQPVKTDADGRAELNLPNAGNYALYVQTPPDPFEYGPDKDVDGGSGGACAAYEQTRCISVHAKNGTVRIHRDTSNQSRLWISFVDVDPEAKVLTDVAEQSTRAHVAGGKFVIELKQADGTWKKVHEFENTDGTERSPDLEKGRDYRLTFTPDPKWTLTNPNHGKSRRVEFNSGSDAYRADFEVTKVKGTAIEEPMVQVDEPDTDYTIEGGWAITPNQPETDNGETRTREPAPSEPAEEAPVEEAPVEEVPAEGAPVEEAPAEEAPVEEAPAEEAPIEEAPTEEAPAEEVPEGTTAPTDDELVANCFMYLELYPELIELDPGLPFWCEENPTVALDVIAELRAGQGN